MFARLKDAAIEKAVLNMLAPRFERYGQILSFKVDSANRVCQAEVLLLGETAPVQISQARYRVEEKGPDTILVLHDIKVSRPWAQNILDDHLRELPIKVPDIVKSLL